MAVLLSEYADSLPRDVKERYLEKLKMIDGVDPYLLKRIQYVLPLSDIPNLTRNDVVNYVMFRMSSYTLEEMKAYKSIEAFEQVICGWVQKVYAKRINTNFLIMAEVMHSQRLRETN